MAIGKSVGSATIVAAQGSVTGSTPASVQSVTPVSLTAVSKMNWTLAYADSQETQCENGAAINSFDASAATIWHTQYCPGVAQLPHEIQIDMGTGNLITGFRYLPRQDGGVNGRIGQYEFYATNDPSNWGTPLATGSFANDATEKQVLFAPNTYRYIRLRALTEANGGPWTSMAELTVLQSSVGGQ
jgi:alpha-glucosidase